MPSSMVTRLLEGILEACVDDRSGVSKDPIPERRTIDPDAFGICLATVDGHVYEVGDTRARFPIQSISKPFTYGIALQDRGADAVAAKIDVEPSGEPFNEISLDRQTGRARNPMINAGAITASSLVAGDTPAEQFARVRAEYSAYTGRWLELSEDVLEAEVRTGDRNRAIGYLLREFGTLECDPVDALDVYLRQCSLLVDCHDLALMGATLATGGVQPRTGERVIAVECADRVLSVMTTCGMYDAAGDWVAEVGMPAKSGVGGGILAVLPGQLSVAVFSPRLDEHGNSVRGVAACEQLSKQLELHFLHVPRGSRSAIESVRDLAAAPSLLERPAADRELLRRHGHRAQVFALHGDLHFAGAEAVARRAEDSGPELDAMILDVRRLGDVSDVTWRLLVGLRTRLEEHDCKLAIVDPDRRLAIYADRAARPDPPRLFAGVETAAIWAEDRLLERYGSGTSAEHRVELADHPLLADLDAERLAPYFETRGVPQGTRVFDAGAPPSGLYLLLAGRVRLSLPVDGDQLRRVATLIPGTAFGQASLVADRPQIFVVDTERPSELAVLTTAAFARCASDDPTLRAALIESVLRSSYDTIDRLMRSAAARTSAA